MPDIPLHHQASKAFGQFHDKRGMGNLKSSVLFEARTAFMAGWQARHEAFHPSRDEIVEVLIDFMDRAGFIFDDDRESGNLQERVSECDLTALWQLFTGETDTTQMEVYDGREP